MHTDNWRTLSGNMEQAVQSAVEHKLEYIEFGVLDGQDFIEGLGYSPAVPLDANPLKLRRELEKRGLRVSQIDAGYPITGPTGATYGVRYIQRAIQFVGINFDTGNTFIAGQDPVAYANRFAKRIRHVHCKDVSRELCDAIRGGLTGIACSDASIGEGVNADNIHGVMRILNGIGWDGVFSIECAGLKETVRKSVECLRKVKGDA